MRKLALLAALVAACDKKQESRNDAPPASAGESFKVKLETNQGDIVILVHTDWAPKGAARFRELVQGQFYDGCRFFRVVPNFVVQFGLNGDPKVSARWRSRVIPDDPVRHSNKKMTVTFATGGPNTRTTQLFINLKDNSELDTRGFSPFGEVVEGMHVVEGINSEYREQPDQGRIQTEGNEYLNGHFPRLDYIKSAKIVE
jgi:peptidyl-prolyl cis-trans isomerase A (cyclophilin A)